MKRMNELRCKYSGLSRHVQTIDGKARQSHFGGLYGGDGEEAQEGLAVLAARAYGGVKMVDIYIAYSYLYHSIHII